MPGPQLQTQAFVLAKLPSGSDTFEQVTAFSAEHGLLHCLARLPRGRSAAAAAPLDLGDETELWLESSNQGRTWFVREHRLVRRHDGLGRSYPALRAAAAIGALVSRNPVPDESRAEIAALLRSSLGALAEGGRPDIIWLKALFRFLRDEGYPAKQQWWPRLPPEDRAAATRLLNQPLAEQTADAATVARLAASLEQWVQAETELRL
ncbi:MAG: hypothetical protein JNG83_09695 [Opitutaceae bacterium]|nr:hypothetical protein [Opitutaceae bacterium]